MDSPSRCSNVSPYGSSGNILVNIRTNRDFFDSTNRDLVEEIRFRIH